MTTPPTPPRLTPQEIVDNAIANMELCGGGPVPPEWRAVLFQLADDQITPDQAVRIAIEWFGVRRF